MIVIEPSYYPGGMFDRKPFRYRLTMLSPTGTKQDEEFATYWSPEKTSNDEILAAATAQFTGRFSHGQPRPVPWRALEAVLLD